tara:strand:+ start:3578 stop:4180 length:603 start_codon:yes stop_codon:yes gene_type:complete
MLPVFPITYFGSIAYYQELAKYSNVIIERKEHFPKQTYRNRCDILAGDGILNLSIPTKRTNGSKTKTEDILLSNEENWRIRHWRSITSAYQAAPYFDHYGLEVKELIFNEETSFLNFNIAITKRILRWLDLNIDLELSTEFSPLIENDYRLDLVAKNKFQDLSKSPYIQVFPNSSSYKESLSILDAIFCEGPMARLLILK